MFTRNHSIYPEPSALTLINITNQRRPPMRLTTQPRLRNQTPSANSISLPRIPPVKQIHTQNISIKE